MALLVISQKQQSQSNGHSDVSPAPCSPNLNSSTVKILNPSTVRFRRSPLVPRLSINS